MPAPANSILDSFNRANENPLSGSGAWSNKIVTTHANMQLTTNAILRAGASAVTSSVWWNAQTYTDCEAFITVATKPTSFIGLYLRVSNPNSASPSPTGYFAWWKSATEFAIYKFNGTVNTLIANFTTTLTFNNGDKLWFEAIGTTLNLYRWDGSSWNLMVTGTDATYSSGYIGILGGTDATWRVDDFGGGIAGNIDEATVTSKTFVSSTEVSAFVDSNTVASKTTPSGADVYTGAGGSNYLDSATPTSRTTPSIVEVAPQVDASTVRSVTTPGVTVELQTSVSIESTGQTVVGATIIFTIVVDIPTATGNPTIPIVDTGDGFVGIGNVVGGETSSSYTGVSGYWGTTDNDDGVII